MFGLLFSWYYQPFIADGQNGPFTAIVFDLRGIALAAWTLTAFAIGALAGILIRRVVLRLSRASPLTPPSPSRPPVGLLQSLCPPSAVGAVKAPPGGHAGLSATKVAKATLTQCVSQHGYTQWTRYQPASRFWSFQLIEAGWLLALSMLLIGATVWSVRRRAA